MSFHRSAFIWFPIDIFDGYWDIILALFEDSLNCRYWTLKIFILFWDFRFSTAKKISKNNIQQIIKLEVRTLELYLFQKGGASMGNQSVIPEVLEMTQEINSIHQHSTQSLVVKKVYAENGKAPTLSLPKIKAHKY